MNTYQTTSLNSWIATVIQALGYTFMIMSVATVMLMVWPIVSIELSYRINQMAQSTQSIATEIEPEYVSFGQLMNPSDDEDESKDEVTVAKNTEFSLVIPKIGVDSSVKADVDAGNKDEYLAVLQKDGLAHANGTYKPGDGGSIFIFGHSTDNFWNVQQFNTKFYLLKELEEGDEVNAFYQGKRHRYIVNNTYITDPSDVSVLDPKKEGEKLIMQTCWPPGTSLKRYIVEAVPVLPSS